MADYKTDIRISDMPEEMKEEVIRCAVKAVIKWVFILI